MFLILLTKIFLHGSGTSKLIIGGPIGESNDDPDDEDALRQANRAMVFQKAAEVIANVVAHIEESQDMCGKSKTEPGNNSPAQQSRNKQQYQWRWEGRPCFYWTKLEWSWSEYQDQIFKWRWYMDTQIPSARRWFRCSYVSFTYRGCKWGWES